MHIYDVYYVWSWLPYDISRVESKNLCFYLLNVMQDHVLFWDITFWINLTQTPCDTDRNEVLKISQAGMPRIQFFSASL